MAITEEEGLKKLKGALDSLYGDQITKDDFLKAFKSVISIITKFQTRIGGDVEALHTSFANLKKQLADDNATDLEEIKMQVKLAVGAAIKELADKFTAIDERIDAIHETDEEALIEQIRTMIPSMETGQTLRNKLESLKGEERLDISSIRGLDKVLADAKKKGDPVRLVGGSNGMFVYVGGVKKGIIKSLNLVAGTGMAIAYSKVNGLDTLTFNASTSGLTIETPAETPDAVIVLFTVSAQPQWVVADGTTYYENAGYTYNSGTGKVTMAVAPSSFIRAII